MSSWLRKAKREISSLDAELILIEALGFSDRSELVLYDTQELTDDERERAERMLAKRKEGVPMAYMLGRKEFYGREFLVTPDTLIPRPETEEIINMAQGSCRSILDVGAGSGCIGVTLALEMPGVEVTCTDISESALGVARENAERLGAGNVWFLRSDLLANYQGERPDIIVANLPYVDRGWEWVSPEIEYEPEEALFAEENGLALIFRLLDEIEQKWYNKEYDYPLYLYLEADPCQHQKIIEYAQNRHFEHIETKGFIIELVL